MKKSERKPVQVNILKYVNFWTKKSLRGELQDKGGSFNLELYYAYLREIYK